MSKPSSSLIISTYNWPQALELCLLSIQAQQTLPEEVLIADDGSGVETLKLIKRFQEIFPVPLHHIWHPDNGFKLAEIRNKAIAQAKGDYIIQVDGDLILHPFFIDDHLRFAKPDTFVRASRIYLDKTLSSQLIKNKDTAVSVFTQGLSNKFSALRLPVLWKFFENGYKAHETYEIHGCNMAYWKQNVLSVNGYNENFKGWGPEDKELVVRLLNKGYKKRFIKLGALVFHLWHQENLKKNLQNNELEFYESIDQKRTFCKLGLNQHM